MEATFSDRRKSVTKSSSDGNVDSSSASLEVSVVIKTAMAREMLAAISISSRAVGRGIKSVARTVTRATARIILLREAKGELVDPVCAIPDLSVTAIYIFLYSGIFSILVYASDAFGGISVPSISLILTANLSSITTMVAVANLTSLR